MKKRMVSKICNSSGESIGETLVALLISSLALVMLAGAVSSAVRIVNKSKVSIDAYYHESEVASVSVTIPDSSSLILENTGGFSAELKHFQNIPVFSYSPDLNAPGANPETPDSPEGGSSLKQRGSG